LASLKRIFGKIWLGAFIAAALIFIVFLFRDHRDKLARVADADWGLLGAAALAQLMYFTATVVSWRKVLQLATGRIIGFGEGLAQILLVNFGKYIPGKVWGLAARGKRLSELGFGLGDIARASYLEQMLLMLVGLWLAFLCAAFVFDATAYWIALLLVTLAIVLFRHGAKLLRGLAIVFPPAGAVASAFELRIGVGAVLGLSMGYIGVWLFLAITFMFVCTAFVDIELTRATVPVFVLSLTAGFLAGFVALFAPGGVGVREGVGAALLANIMSLEDAVLLMLMFRLWIVVMELLAGALMLRGTSTREADGG
jgi:uncharacterized membrane protein YbhN (UPF0104 family)